MIPQYLACRKESVGSIGYLEDSRITEKAAIEEYLQMKKSGNYPNIRFVMSNHWASEGWWIEWGDKLGKLSSKDTVVENPDPNNLYTAR